MMFLDKLPSPHWEKWTVRVEMPGSPAFERLVDSDAAAKAIAAEYPSYAVMVLPPVKIGHRQAPAWLRSTVRG